MSRWRSVTMMDWMRGSERVVDRCKKFFATVLSVTFHLSKIRAFFLLPNSKRLLLNNLRIAQCRRYFTVPQLLIQQNRSFYYFDVVGQLHTSQLCCLFFATLLKSHL
uniref:Uncharacterized protein n=1 Tax=Wuchereria bancrofti TaxID=6293 RepID=A0A1I8EQJ0_WUCBA